MLFPPEPKPPRPTLANPALSRASGYNTAFHLPPLSDITSPKLHVPSHVAGVGIPLVSETETMWHLPLAHPPLSEFPALNTPRILDMDVNQEVRAAQKVLKKVRRRPSFPVARADPIDLQELQERAVDEAKIRIAALTEAEKNST